MHLPRHVTPHSLVGFYKGRHHVTVVVTLLIFQKIGSAIFG